MPLLRRFAPDLGATLLLLLLPLFFFLPQTLGGRTLIPAENLYQYQPYATYREVVSAPDVPHNHLVSDLVLQNYQWKAFIKTQLAAGEVPLWNPHQLGGIPFLAAGQHSALYPLSAIYYLLPLWLAYGWFTVVNLWLAGVFMYLFARVLGIGRAGALLAGIVYQFSGFVIASVVFQMMIGGLPWLPLLLLALEAILSEKPFFGRTSAIPWVALGAGALGLNVLAGHVEITLYSLLIAGYFAGIRWLVDWMRSKKHRAALEKAAWMLATVALGFGLGAAQFIPLYDFVQTNWRAERGSYETVVGYAHPVRDVLQFVVPNFYGSPAHHSIYDLFTGQTVTDLGTNQNHTEWGMKNYVEGALYLGILPLLLAGYALIERVRGWREYLPVNHIIFASLGVLSLTFMFGLPTYRLIYVLPGFNQLNSPFRWIYALTVCVALLAAFGLDAMLRRAAEPNTRLISRAGYALIALALLIFAGLGGGFVAFDSLQPQLERLLDSLALARNAFSSAQLFFSYQFVNVAILGAVLLAIGVLWVFAGKIRRLNLWAGLLLAIVAADLMIASWGFNPASDPALLEFTPPAVEWLQQQAGDFRYTTLESSGTPIFNANSTLQYGLDDIRGYDSIIPREYVQYMRELAPQVQLDFNRIAPVFTDPDYNRDGGYTMLLDSPLFDLLNVRYVVADKDVVVPFQEWALVYEDEAVRIWENDSAVPRAYLVNPDEMPQTWLPPQSAAPDFYARDVIPPYDAAPLAYDSGREKLLDVALDGERWLIVSENYAPGWKAFIRPQGSGEDAENPLDLVRVAGIFQGVLLPQGEWTVRLVYSPQSFQVGFFGSAISVVILTLLVGMWVWRIFVGTNSEQSSQTARVARNSIAPILLNLFNRGIDFIFAIIMYRLLAPESVGVYNFAVVVFVWFDIFTNFGLDLFLIREVSRDKARSGLFLYNTSFLRFFLSIIGAGLLLLFLVLWQNSVEPLPQEGLVAIGLLYLGLFPASLSKGMTSVYYAHEQAEKPAAIATITTINKVIFGVMVLLLGWGIVGLAAVSIANNLLTLGVLIFAGRKLIQGLPQRPQLDMIRGMVKESVPLLLNHFLATIFFQIDIVILQAIKGSVIVAQYSTSYKWLLAINIVPAFFTQALFPVLSRQAQENLDSFRRTYTFGIKLLVTLAFPLAVAFTLLAEPLTLILAGANYLPNGAIALTIMIWSIPLGWMNSLTQYALIALNLQRHITRAFFVAVLFNIITNIIFIPQFNFQAAAVTTILSELVLLLPFAWLMGRGLGQHLNWFGLLWRPVLAALLMIGAALLLLSFGVLVALIGSAVVYLGALLLLNPLDEQERAQLRPLLPARLRGML